MLHFYYVLEHHEDDISLFPQGFHKLVGEADIKTKKVIPL